MLLYRTSSACLNDLLGGSPQACCVFLCFYGSAFYREIFNALGTNIVTASFSLVKGHSAITSRVWYWFFKDLPFWARPRNLSCATSRDYTPYAIRVKGFTLVIFIFPPFSSL
jgi:hypothetical protein